MVPVIYDFTFFGLLKEPWSLHTYGVLICAAFLTATSLAKRQALREGEDPDRVVDLSFWILVWGLIGSRVVFILTKFDEYIRNPAEIFMFWRGVLVWYGGFIGAALYLVYHSRKQRLDFFKIGDLFIPYMALAHAIGRLGCIAAGCCHGRPADVPWAISFPKGSMAHSAQQISGLIGVGDAALPVHPTQLYEAGFEIAMFWLLLFWRPRKRFHGQLVLIWLAIYPIARSIIELFRGDKERGVWALGLSTSQYISIAVACFAIWLFFSLRRKRLRAAST